MRQYLALQAMESGKGFYMGDRYRMSAFGNGTMLMPQETQPQGKIGEFRLVLEVDLSSVADPHGRSHPPLQLPVA